MRTRKRKTSAKCFWRWRRDVRVILIKLADRLHNMRTLEAMRPEKRRRIARETMEIYAPIANRLGLNNIYHELQELSFRYVFPTRYRVLANATKAARGNRREMVTKILDAIKQRLKTAGLDAEVSGREKQLYSIYKKMAEKASYLLRSSRHLWLSRHRQGCSFLLHRVGRAAQPLQSHSRKIQGLYRHSEGEWLPVIA